MAHRKNATIHKHSMPQSRRPTLGLLTHSIADIGGYVQTLIDGVVSFAKEEGANLICFSGGYLYPHGYAILRSHANLLYDLVSPAHIDGVITVSSLSYVMGYDKLAELCDRYRPLPVVCAGDKLPGFPSVIVDNKAGMRSLMLHLVKDHGYRRIAFIQGHQEALDASARYQVYADVLVEHGIPLDPALVAPGTYAYPSGMEAVAVLLDQRKVQFDALVAANDEMAIGALSAFQERGIRVPGDIALAGFDNLKEGWFAMPPLTTVQQPVHEIGRRAAEMVWAQLHGEEVLEQVILPTQLVVRQSCGCPSRSALQAAVGIAMLPEQEPDESLPAALAAHQETIIYEMIQAVGAQTGAPETGLIAQLLDDFICEIDHSASSGTFLAGLTELLRQSRSAGTNIDSWQEAISVLRRHLVPYLASDSQTLLHAEDLWHQARIVIGEVAVRVQAHVILESQREMENQRRIGQALISTFEMDRLMDALAEGLPHLDITSAYLSLYDDAQDYSDSQLAPKWSRLILAYNEAMPPGLKRANLPPDGLRFASRQLAPEGMLPRDRRYTFVVEALHFMSAQIGFCLFEMGAWKPQRGENAYDSLRGQISSAIQGSRFFQARRRAERAFEKQAQELERSNAELEQFAYIASHDLQEPLRMVSSYLQLLERRYKNRLDQDADEFIAFAVDGATRMHTLIHDLLAYSRVDTRGKSLEPTDCSVVIERVLDILKVTIEEHDALVICDPMPTVLADDVQLTQVFQNLIGNAIKFHRPDVRPEVHIGARQRDDSWEFSIHDNGIGIDPQYFERIFMVFQRLHTHQQYPGTGIGLAVCKKIIERHGGHIWVESAVGKGTTFFFTLPAVA